MEPSWDEYESAVKVIDGIRRLVRNKRNDWLNEFKYTKDEDIKAQ